MMAVLRAGIIDLAQWDNLVTTGPAIGPKGIVQGGGGGAGGKGNSFHGDAEVGGAGQASIKPIGVYSRGFPLHFDIRNTMMQDLNEFLELGFCVWWDVAQCEVRIVHVSQLHHLRVCIVRALLRSLGKLAAQNIKM